MMGIIDRYAAAMGIGLVGVVAGIFTAPFAGEQVALAVFRVFLTIAYLWLFGNAAYDLIITPLARIVRKKQRF